MVVAPGAAEGQAQPGQAGGLDAVDHGLDPPFLGDRAALAGQPVVPVEAGGDELVAVRLGQEVAGDLLDGELIERQVPVERADHPVAPGGHVAAAVGLVAVAVGVSGEVEPGHRHPLAVVVGGEQAVDGLLVGVGRVVGEERRDLDRRGGQAGQVEGRSSQERDLVGFSRGLQTLGLEPGEDERIHRIPGPGRRLHGRDFGPMGRVERPVPLIPGTTVDPSAEGLLLGGGDRLAELGRGHQAVGLVGVDPIDQLAFLWLPGDDRDEAGLRGPGRLSRRSSRRPALRAASSGPWQAKQ